MPEEVGRDKTGKELPVLINWKRLYAIVLLNLCFWILVFYLIKRIFE